MICDLCPRHCRVDRQKAVGYCGSPSAFRVSRAALHFWEEPCISGKNGSGAVFFSGCNLRCVFCQNYEISYCNKGVEISDDRLVHIFEDLIRQGANNINLVNPTHYSDRIADVLSHWRSPVPIVYNTSGYESVDSLRRLEGLVDIYLPDYKYSRGDKALRYSGAGDYPDVVVAALAEMRRQVPTDVFDENGIMQTGMIVRHLVLPSNTNSSIEIIDSMNRDFSGTYLSLMAQYLPCGELGGYKEINRRITAREYNKVVDYALDQGMDRLFLQELSSADDKYIPAFDFTGVL